MLFEKEWSYDLHVRCVCALRAKAAGPIVRVGVTAFATGIVVGRRELLLRHDHVGHRYGELEAGGAWEAADGDFG